MTVAVFTLWFLTQANVGQVVVGVILLLVGEKLRRGQKAIQVNVDGRLDKEIQKNAARDDRIQLLEQKLQLTPGQTIPTGQVETTET